MKNVIKKLQIVTIIIFINDRIIKKIVILLLKYVYLNNFKEKPR